MATIAELRAHMGWSQGDLAERLGVNRVTVSQWECGRVRVPFDAARQMWLLFGTVPKHSAARRYPHNPGEVLLGYLDFTEDTIVRGARILWEGGCADSYAQGYMQALGGTARDTARLLSAIGSYAKSLGWGASS